MVAALLKLTSLLYGTKICCYQSDKSPLLAPVLSPIDCCPPANTITLKDSF